MASSSTILALFSAPQLLKIDIVHPTWTNQTRAIILKMQHYSIHIYVFWHKYSKHTYIYIVYIVYKQLNSAISVLTE